MSEMNRCRKTVVLETGGRFLNGKAANLIRSGGVVLKGKKETIISFKMQFIEIC